jgi:hypothetical protein
LRVGRSDPADPLLTGSNPPSRKANPMTDPSVRNTKRADELKPGDWIAECRAADEPAEILAVIPWTTRAAGGPMVSVVYARPADGRPTPWDMPVDDLMPLATEEELSGRREAAERAQRIADIRAFADWLEQRPWLPMPTITAYVHMHDPAAVERVRDIAKRLGLKADDSLNDRTDVEYNIGKIRYAPIAWHKDGRPTEPKTEREGPWFEVGDRVTFRGWEASQYHRAGLNVVGTVVETRPIKGSNPSRQQFRAEGADWCGGGSMWNHSDGYEPAPVDDPTGLLHSRADDGDDPTPPGERQPARTGAMTDGGLVDETPIDPDSSMEAHYDAETEAGIFSPARRQELRWKRAVGTFGSLTAALNDAHARALLEDNDRAKALVEAWMTPADEGRIANPNLAYFMATREDRRRRGTDGGLVDETAADAAAITGAAVTESCVFVGDRGGWCKTHEAVHIASGVGECGCPVYPFAGRGDAADTIVDHRRDCPGHPYADA